MAIFINTVCDGPGCKTYQAVAFDALTETWGDMLAALRAAGWRLEGDGARVTAARCPRCAAGIPPAAPLPAPEG